MDNELKQNFPQQFLDMPTSSVIEYLFGSRAGDQKNFRIPFRKFLNDLGISATGGAPIFFTGNQLPDKNNSGGDLEKGSWALLTAGQTYSNINSGPPITAPLKRMSISIFNGSIWELKDLGAMPDQVADGAFEKNNPNPISGGEAYSSVPSLEDVGIQKLSSGENVILKYSLSDFGNEDLFEEGFYHKVGGSKQPSTSVVRSKSLIPIKGGLTYDYSMYLFGNAGVVFFDSDGVAKNVISTTNSGSTYLTGQITLDPTVVAFGLSVSISGTLSNIHLNATEDVMIYTNEVFPTIDFLNDLLNAIELNIKESVGFDESENKFKDKPFITYETFEKFGFRIFKSGENMVPFFNPIDAENNDFWQNGYLRNSGIIQSSDTVWRNSIPIVKMPTGSYSTNLVYAGNSFFWIVDKNGNMKRSIGSVGNNLGTSVWSFNIDNANGEYGVKIGVSRTVLDLYNPDYYIKTNQDIWYKIEDEVSPADRPQAVIKNLISIANPIKRVSPIITFISDDGSIYNDWFIEALDVYNWKATFAIITGRLPDTTPTLQEFYNKEAVVNLLLNKGHEVAGHTVSHNSSAQLATLTEDELHFEIGRCKMTLLSIDDRIEALNFISPFGSRSLNVDRVVRHYFEANYISRTDADVLAGTGINYPPIDNYFMKRASFDNPAGPGAINVSRIDFAKQAIDYVNANGGWLIFAIHPHYAQYMDPANTVDSRQELRDTLAYINTLNIPVLTAKQARKHYKNVSIGNYRLDSSFYERGINGTEIGTLLS